MIHLNTHGFHSWSNTVFLGLVFKQRQSLAIHICYMNIFLIYFPSIKRRLFRTIFHLTFGAIIVTLGLLKWTWGHTGAEFTTAHQTNPQAVALGFHYIHTLPRSFLPEWCPNPFLISIPFVMLLRLLYIYKIRSHNDYLLVHSF